MVVQILDGRLRLQRFVRHRDAVAYRSNTDDDDADGDEDVDGSTQ